MLRQVGLNFLFTHVELKLFVQTQGMPELLKTELNV